VTDVGQVESKTQKRVIGLFEKRLGFEFLGDWKDRPANGNVDHARLAENLKRRGYDDTTIARALDQLDKANHLGGGRDLYEANREIYDLLRYGVKVRRQAGEQKETVWLIDWDDVDANDFGLAEEVTVAGQHTKRPDLVVYVNGIALVVIELKRSKVAASEGIRQTIGNQKSEFIRPFFTTVQLVMAGNDVEGLHYAVIDTPEKHWLNWRLPSEIHATLRQQIDAECDGIDGILDQAFVQLCSKRRLLEVIHDFVVFDAGVKKTCRPNQYFGVKAAQERVAENDGGIIWHTQGSGKSLTMVWLAKWLREHYGRLEDELDGARVLLITDRTELDEQIEGVFNGVNEAIYRSTTGRDLLDTLNRSTEWLICSLIHKFRGSGESEDQGASDAEVDDFLTKLRSSVPDDFAPKGKLFVFVDEAHRTQSGKMHRAMKALLPDAIFIGFTGTPLLKSDKTTTLETFGPFIHIYKFDEAVRDRVVLDLRYEARDVDQQLTSHAQVDKWFELKTRGMTSAARAQLKARWGTMQALYSSASRTQQIVQDILIDMDTKPRLADGRGNALLVCSSIYQAATFYEQFGKAGLKSKCAVVTSYEPQAGDIAKEDSGEGATEKQRQYDIYKQMLADFEMDDVEAFEKEAKRRFIEEPGQMRLLIVVDKLLTGFDAPPATYLYIDKKMRDHGLFQAICRVNRLDGEDKDYGYIVDYRDLFKSLNKAVKHYATEALDGYDTKDVDELLKDRVAEAKADLEDAMAKVEALCEGVEQPRTTVRYHRYFCAKNAGDVVELAANEPKRIELYKSVAALVRAYGNFANDFDAVGYTPEQVKTIREKVSHYADVRDEVKLGAGEAVDFKKYEAGMRFLLDTYIQASPSEGVGDLADTGLIQMFVNMGESAVDKLPEGIKKDPEAVTETIINNVRMLITDERPTNPKYFDKMSELLDGLIEQRRREAGSYQKYLRQLVALVKKISAGESDAAYPTWADNGARRALIDFELPGGEETAKAVEDALTTNRRADWVGNVMKERRIRRAIEHALPSDYDRADELMELLRQRVEYR
jgi:type I restriction enzyme R subunit